MDKYINDSIIGNSNILVSLNKKGDILRFFAPSIDYFQHVEELLIGIVIDSKLYWLNDDSIFKHEQYLEQNANIVYTKIYNDNICIEQRDFVDVNSDVLVRKYIITKNVNNSNVELLIYSDKYSSLTRFVSGQYNKDMNCLIQYAKDSFFTIFSKSKIQRYKVNGSKKDAENLIFNEIEYEGLSKISYITYSFDEKDNFGEKEVSLTVFIGMRENKILNNKMIETVRKIDEELMYSDTKKYWLNIINSVKKYDFKNEKEREIYFRSVLTLPMYVNNVTGGCIASCEVDESIKKCGRYAYCWPRDAMYFMKALNSCGLNKISNLFYFKFARLVQSENGMWEQRFYTDGSLAPCWGEQTDQTASMVIGLIEQYMISVDDRVKSMYIDNIERGVDYLLSILNEHGLNNDTYDLWETFYGKNQYTLASIYCAFNEYLEISINIEKNDMIKNIMGVMRQRIFNDFWDDNQKSYIKGLNNNIICAESLGLVWPFEMCDANDEKMQMTVRKIEEMLTSSIGGIKRFQGDTYIGGNPWILCTLWLSIYYIKKYKITKDVNDNIKAIEYFDWVTNHSTLHGYLPEQVLENNERREVWVNALAWSHALYIICVEELYGKK